MVNAHVERHLAAILAADVAGYSRLMGVDEEGTHAALKVYRREIIDPKITEHRGRIVRIIGDGLLVEFASVIAAVRWAVDVVRWASVTPACLRRSGSSFAWASTPVTSLSTAPTFGAMA